MIMNAMERALYDRLQMEREVHFRYRKENGELRDACGTCNLDFIPRHKWPAKHLPNIWIALACQTSNNGSDNENFALKKDTIIVKFTTNGLVTRIEKDM